MSQKLKSVFLILIDAVIVGVVPFLALIIRFEGDVDSRYYITIFKFLPLIVTIRLVSFYICGLYHRMWRYASISELLAIACAVTVSTIVIDSYLYFTNTGLPRSIYLLAWLLNIAMIGGSRLVIRLRHYFHQNMQDASTKVLIVGAGDAGAMIARELQNRYFGQKKLVGFVDDAEYKHNRMIYGVKVLGTRNDIHRIVEKQMVNEIIIAMPSIGGNAIRGIVSQCAKTNCKVQTVPGIYELLDGKIDIQQLRSIDLEDLLRRDPVKLDIDEISGYLKGKRVLVTGAGGSIGSELCRQIARLDPNQLVLLGKGENSIYEIEQELRQKNPRIIFEPVIADIRDQARVDAIFRRLRPQVVFHAAAHKHVPLMECQPEEAVQNNIFGTKTVAEAADRHNTEVFVMISTDKAVNPTSVMGATKRVAELIISSLNQTSNTRFTAVRFGNVLGSRGSVIPLFKKQIAAGGPVTVTHPEMRRYFMTIPEATQLVLQAGSMAAGGEVFVLDMGEPIKILDMARDLIELSGRVPGEDIEIQYTGLRPGEKLFEELLTAEEGTVATRHEKIYKANIRDIDKGLLQKRLHSLRTENSNQGLINVLNELVPTYCQTQIVKSTPIVVNPNTKGDNLCETDCQRCTAANN